METEETAIRAGEFSLFPSQSAEDLARFRLCTAREICLDPGIPELLKDCTEELDKLEPQGCLKLRGRLLHQGFRPQTPLFLPNFSFPDLTDYIITRTNRGFRVQGYNQRSAFYNKAWESAWSLLLAAGPDRELYELCRAGWRELPDYVGQDRRFDARMWSNASRGVLNLLLVIYDETSDQAVAMYPFQNVTLYSIVRSLCFLYNSYLYVTIYPTCFQPWLL